MPIFTVEIDGDQYDIEGDHEPSEAEARAAVSGYSTDPAQTQPTAPRVAPGIIAALGAAKLAPAVVSGINKLAPAVGKAAGNSMVPGAAALTAATQLGRGDVGGAAKTAGVTAALSQVPKVAGVIQRATAPIRGALPNGAKWAMKAGQGPAVTRGAAWVSKLAGRLGPMAMAAGGIHDLGNFLSEWETDPNTDPRVVEALRMALDRQDR